MKDFEFIEHTADLGIRVKGDTLEGLFENAALCLFSLMSDYKPEGKIEEKIILEGEDLEELFVTWLNELNSMFFTYKFLPAKYNIKITHDEPQYKVLEGVLLGEEFDPYENKISREIKAATYHNLKVEKIDNKWQAEVIFDV